jgi:predicted Zn-dependent peptidase
MVMRRFEHMLPSGTGHSAMPQARSRIVLKQKEGAGAGAAWHGRALAFDRFYDLDELIAKIEAVTVEDLTELANEFFKTEAVAVTVLGNLPGLKITRDQLAC